MLYVDGVLVASNTAGTLAEDSLDVWIGGSPDYGTARLFPGNPAHAGPSLPKLFPWLKCGRSMMRAESLRRLT
ncbi:MAG TPA: hypothetical protein VIK53_11975 [Verrucomicrobiae bacterium]